MVKCLFLLAILIHWAYGWHLSSPSISYSSKLSSGVRSMQMMPLGVPKVGYKVPHGRYPEWVDIYQRLNRERIIFLTSEIDDEIANQVIGLLLYLDNENPNLPIYLYINCAGGSVLSGLSIYDTMQHIRSEIVTVNMGLAASMASFLLSAGCRGHRYALPHSRTMIHQPSGRAQGQAEDIRIEVNQVLRMKANIIKQYSMLTGKSVDQITKDIDRDNYMSASEAVEYGLVDEIIAMDPEKVKNLELPPKSVEPQDFEYGALEVHSLSSRSSDFNRRR